MEVHSQSITESALCRRHSAIDTRSQVTCWVAPSESSSSRFTFQVDCGVCECVWMRVNVQFYVIFQCSVSGAMNQIQLVRKTTIHDAVLNSSIITNNYCEDIIVCCRQNCLIYYIIHDIRTAYRTNPMLTQKHTKMATRTICKQSESTMRAVRRTRTGKGKGKAGPQTCAKTIVPFFRLWFYFTNA